MQVSKLRLKLRFYDPSLKKEKLILTTIVLSGLCLQRLSKTFVEGFASFRTFAPRLEVANFVAFCSPYQAFPAVPHWRCG